MQGGQIQAESCRIKIQRKGEWVTYWQITTNSAESAMCIFSNLKFKYNIMIFTLNLNFNIDAYSRLRGSFLNDSKT